MKFEFLLYLLSWGACAWMTGIILVMQFIHYPNFKYIEKNSFPSFSKQHAKNITYIVFPPMLLELLCSFVLIYLFPNPLAWANFIGVILLWLITGLKSARDHHSLAKKYSDETLNRLLWWNSWRTFIWFGRFILISYILFNQ